MRGKTVATCKNKAGAAVQLVEKDTDYYGWECTGCGETNVGGMRRTDQARDAQKHADGCGFTPAS